MYSQGKTFGTPPLAIYGGGSLVADNNGGTLVVALGTLGGIATDTSTNASVGNALNIVATDSNTSNPTPGTSTITTTTNKDATRHIRRPNCLYRLDRHELGHHFFCCLTLYAFGICCLHDFEHCGRNGHF